MSFVIIATPRSGSDLLVDIINRFEGIVCYGEVLHTNSWHRERIAGCFWNGFDPNGFLDRHVYVDGTEGFKFIRTLDDWKSRLDSIRPTLMKLDQILLLKRNPLHQWVSLQVALRTGVIRAEPEDQTPTFGGTLYPSFHDLWLFFNWLDQFWADAMQTLVGVPAELTELDYTALGSIGDSLAESFGTRFLELPCKRKKLNLRRPSELIANFSEIKKEFEGTRYSSYFEES